MPCKLQEETTRLPNWCLFSWLVGEVGEGGISSTSLAFASSITPFGEISTVSSSWGFGGGPGPTSGSVTAPWPQHATWFPMAKPAPRISTSFEGGRYTESLSEPSYLAPCIMKKLWSTGNVMTGNGSSVVSWWAAWPSAISCLECSRWFPLQGTNKVHVRYTFREFEGHNLRANTTRNLKNPATTFFHAAIQRCPLLSARQCPDSSNPLLFALDLASQSDAFRSELLPISLVLFSAPPCQMLSNQDTFYLLRGPTWKCPHASVPASASISTLVMFRRCWLMDSSTPRLNKPSLWVCLQLTSDKLHANKLNETVASLATVTSLWLKMAEVKTMEMWGERPPQECPTYTILQSYHILSCIYIYICKQLIW